MPRNNINIGDLIDARVRSGFEYRMTEVMEARVGGEKGDRKIVRGYATTFDQKYLLADFGNYKIYEVVDRHAFDEADMSDVIMQYDHQGRVFARNRNKTLSLAADDHGLAIEADLTDTALGNQVYEEISGGYTDKMSMAFRVGEDKREVVENADTGIITITRTITKIAKLYDVSAVSYPANDATEISARSFLDGILEEIRKDALEAEERARKAQAITIMIDTIGKDN